MAGKGREVADAYIDVHGDISKFRNSINKAKPQMKKTGDEYGKAFNDAFDKRIAAANRDRWDGIFDALYSKGGVDWEKALGKFDSKDLDNAHKKLNEFMDQYRKSGDVTEKQFTEISKASSKAVKFIKEQRAAIEASEAAAKKYGKSLEGIFENAKVKNFEKDMRKLADFMSGADVGPNTKSIDSVNEFKARMMETLTKAREMGRVNDSTFKQFRKTISSITPDVTRVADGIDKVERRTNLFSKATKALGNSWKSMDDDVRLIIGLIVAGAGPMAAGMSGLAASLTAVVSSAAMAAAAVVPLASAFAGLGVGVALAVSGFENMVKRFPGIKTQMEGIGDVWEAQATRFGTAWGPAFESFLGAFRKQLGSVDFGTALGKSFSSITGAFEKVVSGSGFTAFMKAMGNDIPAAVAGIGTGLAGVTDALMNLLAGAAPVAKLLGEDFARWGTELGKAAEKARESGKMNEVFMLARESLKSVLDLAGSLGKALGAVFMAGAESGNRLLDSLTGVIDKFTAWTQTVEGQNSLEEWFSNGERIIKSFEPLLVGLAGFFDNLVTPYAINQFTSLMDKLGQFLPILGEVLNVVSNLGIFNILVDALLGIGAALQPLLPSLSQLAIMLGEGISGAITALSPLFQALGQALAPIIATFVEIAGVVIPVLVDAFGRIATALQPVIAVIGLVVSAILDTLAPVLGPLLTGIINAAVGFIEGIATAFMGVVNVIKGLFSGDWMMVWEGIKMIVSGAIEAIWNFIQLTLVGKTLGAIKGFLLGAKTFFQTTWMNISTTFNTILTSIWNFVKSIFTGMGTSIKTILNGIKAVWSTVWNGIKAFTSTVWNGIKTVVSTVFNAIKSFITNTVNKVKSVWTNVWNAIKTVAKNVWNGIKSLISNAVNNVKSTISNTVNNIKSLWNAGWNVIRNTASNVWNAIKNVVRNAINGVRNTINSIMNSIRNTISNIWNGIRSVFSNALNAVKSIVRNGFNAMQNAVRNGISNAVGFVRGLPGKIRSALGSVGSLLSGAGRAIMDGLLGGLKRAWNGVKNFVGGVADWIRNNKGPISYDRKLLIPAGNAIMEGLGKGLEAMLPKLKDKLDIITGTMANALSSKKLTKAADSLATTAVDAMGTSKLYLAGRNAADQLANGLKEGRRGIEAAMAGLGPDGLIPDARLVGSVHTARAPQGQAQAPTGATNQFNEGAIQVITPAQDARVVASQMLDEFTRHVGG